MARDSGEPGAPGITRDGPERHLDASARHPGDHRDPPAGCRHRRTSGQLLPTVSTRHPGRAHSGNLTRQRGCGRFRKPRNSLPLRRTSGGRYPPQRIDRRSAGRRTHRADPGRAFHRPPLRGAVLPGTNPHQYPDTEIENAGTWNYLSSLPPRYTRLFRNLPGATYTLTHITSVPSNEPEPGIFDNAGPLRKIGSGNAFLPFAFTNRGVIELTGNLSFNRAFTPTETGLSHLGGGRLFPAGAWRLILGEFHGPGVIGSDSGSFYVITHSALLRPGGPAGFGILTFGATSTHLGPERRVNLRIGGPTPGIEHDHLLGNNSLWLGGNLRLDFVQGFVPPDGSKFLIVSAPSRLQTFRSTFEVAGLPAGRALRLNYTSGGVEAEIIAGP